MHSFSEPALFSLPWWLDAVAPGMWNEVVVEKGGQILARMPYVMYRRYGFTYVAMPKLTQTLGPWLRQYPGKYSNRLSEEKQLLDALIDQLPPFDVFSQNFHYSITNWLPFYWRSFQQTTRYTYVLDHLNDLEKIYSEFTPAKRKNIKKAEQIVEVCEDLPASEFYANHVLTLKKQGQAISYDYELFERIYHAAYQREAGKVFYAVDRANNLHAAIFIVWDEQSAYYLISTIDTDFRNSGSATLLVWKAIQFCASRTKRFDFEGSMIEGVENSFRSFGAKQIPYFNISKVSSLPIKIFRDISSWLRH